MLNVELPKGWADYRILCLESHSDDVEIAYGGTILHVLKNHRVMARPGVLCCISKTSAVPFWRF
jgi:LmbE family N-acetylglucosaminyl deacetylase